jgi:hypothetical protein
VTIGGNSVVQDNKNAYSMVSDYSDPVKLNQYNGPGNMRNSGGGDNSRMRRIMNI